MWDKAKIKIELMKRGSNFALFHKFNTFEKD